MQTAVLIPAYKPGIGLVDLVKQLSQSDIDRVVIVDDGSGDPYQDIFSQVRLIPGVDLLIHPLNQGKGAALKTGFTHILSLDEYSCVVTADADGQHAAKDILAVAATAKQNPDALIIGSRRFDKDVPLRSMFGNTVTRWVLRLFFSVKLWDTQSGLRGIPRSLLPALIEIPYDHYELEAEMLMIAHRRRVSLLEIPIETIYIEDNRSSHFKPLLDSTRVYFVLFRYMLNSLVTAGADYLVFILVHALTQHIPLSILLARIVSIVVN